MPGGAPPGAAGYPRPQQGQGGYGMPAGGQMMGGPGGMSMAQQQQQQQMMMRQQGEWASSTDSVTVASRSTLIGPSLAGMAGGMGGAGRGAGPAGGPTGAPAPGQWPAHMAPQGHPQQQQQMYYQQQQAQRFQPGERVWGMERMLSSFDVLSSQC